MDLKHELERELSRIEPSDLWARIQAEAVEAAAPSVVRLTRERHRRRVAVWPAVAAVIALFVVGLAIVRQDPEPEVVNPSEVARLEEAVITLQDVAADGENWSEASSEQVAQRRAEEAELADCLGAGSTALLATRAHASGLLVSEDFDNPQYVLSTATAFQSPIEAQALVDQIADPATEACYQAVVEHQVLAQARHGLTSIQEQPLAVDDIEIRGTTVAPTSLMHYVSDGPGTYHSHLEEVGDHRAGYLFTVTLASEGVEVEVHTALAFATTGRMAVQLLIQTYFFPSDDLRIGSLVQSLLDRLSPAPDSDTPAVSEDPLTPEGPVTTEPLPQAGEQPADAATAEEQVRDAYVGLFDSSTSREARAGFSERPSIWTAANQQLEEGEYAEFVEGLYASVDEVVFTDPTHAAVRFRLLRPAGSIPQSVEIGGAVLVDGRWLVAIDTTCALVQAASVDCDPSP